MILQALTELYDRQSKSGDSDIAPPGYEWKELPFIISLKPTGQPVAITDTREGEGKARRAKKFLVPQAVKRASGVRANFLWDNIEYSLGIPRKTNAHPTSNDLVKVKQRHDAFKDKLNELECEDEGLNALRQFCKIVDKSAILKELTNYEEMIKDTGFISFSIVGEAGLIVDRAPVKSALVSAKNKLSNNAASGRCLVSGDLSPIAELHAAIKGVRGAQSSGANIVSFNLAAFCSYGSKQGWNAPIGHDSAFAYTTALNNLLARESRQRIQIGDSTCVFWAEKQNLLEEIFLDIFEEPGKDNPKRGIKAVKSIYTAISSGILPSSGEGSRFFVLGLSPNASRISVRFWMIASVQTLAERIVQHFDDLAIVRSAYEPEVLSLFRLLISIASQGKSENIPPNLAGDLTRAIIEGLPYPRSLLGALVRRIRAEQGAKVNVTYPRAALLKAIINRNSRFYNLQQKEITMTLDDENNNPGYLLGRLFAVLEKIQTEASPGINATIRDRFYGSASGTPVAVFGSLMRMKNHHLAKIENAGRRVYFENLLGSILQSIDDFPPHLNLADQGRFAIGYYHQNHHFYTGKNQS